MYIKFDKIKKRKEKVKSNKIKIYGEKTFYVVEFMSLLYLQICIFLANFFGGAGGCFDSV